jgi:hypothetical protein
MLFCNRRLAIEYGTLVTVVPYVNTLRTELTVTYQILKQNVPYPPRLLLGELSAGKVVTLNLRITGGAGECAVCSSKSHR